MSIMFEIIKVALHISAIAFSPTHREIILELGSKHLLYYNIDTLSHISTTKRMLLGDIKRDTHNTIPIDIFDYPFWQIQPSHPAIISTKNKSIDIISFDGSTLVSFENPQISDNPSTSKSHAPDKPNIKPLIYNVFGNNDLSTFLCITSKPVNLDFEETGVALNTTADKKFQTSKLIKTFELDIQAVWNQEYKSFLIVCNAENKFYSWFIDNGEAVEIPYTTTFDNSSLVCKINPDGKALFIIEDNHSLDKTLLTIGTLNEKGVSWQAPVAVNHENYIQISTNPAGDKILLLSEVSNGYQLTILENDGTIRSKNIIQNQHYEAGIGWLTDSLIICAGSSDLLLFNTGKFAQGPSPGALKRKSTK